MSLITQERAQALQTLGLSQQSNDDEIRAAWKRLALEMHPDRRPDGAEEFQRIRAAYDFLRKDQTPAQPANRLRPRIVTRIVDLSTATEALVDSLGETPKERAADQNSDHVASAMRRKGRTVTYFIKTPLREGQNRVALPTGALEDNRKVMPKVLKFMSAHSGAGRIVVPDSVRTKMFPGARSVHIEFACA